MYNNIASVFIFIYLNYLETSGFAASARHNSRFATVAPHILKKIEEQSLRDCDSAYLTKKGNSHFVNVALHIKKRFLDI